jgi:hypothetical protein
MNDQLNNLKIVILVLCSIASFIILLVGIFFIYYEVKNYFLRIKKEINEKEIQIQRMIDYKNRNK